MQSPIGAVNQGAAHRRVPAHPETAIGQDERMRVLMAGASGYLGTKLTTRLRADEHEVVRLVRRPTATPDEVSWDPDAGRLDPAAVAAVDAVINLAGTPLGMRLGRVQLPIRPWTRRYRRAFDSSRIDTTAVLSQAIAVADPKPTVFLCGSAAGWYGDTGDDVVDEQSPGGSNGFLTRNAREWEAAADPARAAGVRVVHLRTGFPLHRDGGYLGPQLLPFRLGLGGKVGNGTQWQPWISLTDWLEATVFLLDRDDIAGPVNMVGPTPATNIEFTRALGKLLHRPTLMPLPGPLLRLMVGEFGRDALVSKRLVPGVLLSTGFQFTHPDLESALRAALFD
jgi:uncharacterized protein